MSKGKASDALVILVTLATHVGRRKPKGGPRSSVGPCLARSGRPAKSSGSSGPSVSQVDIEILRLQAEVLAQLVHLLLQRNQGQSDPVDLLIGRVARLDPAHACRSIR
jgi:hypothetical protein